jgi:ubiquinone/menaquinone biosynthesis C-methylase UbiE
MNRQELDRNNQLTERRVQDLNKDSSLSTYSDASFDAVLLQLSIDYLVHPVEVLRDVSRVLVPGGLLIIRYSIITYLTMMIIMLELTSGYLYCMLLDGSASAIVSSSTKQWPYGRVSPTSTT